MADLKPETRDAVRAGCVASAKACWPLIAAELGFTRGSVLDVGTGEGHWLDAAEEHLGALDSLGLDLRSGQSPGGLPIACWDAEEHEPLPASGSLTRRWDVALCLEVAEHVTPIAGAWLVSELCRVSEVVVWSAAIPGQGGDGHINEQWPAYWEALFRDHGWMLRDPFRSRLWHDARVEPWYAQNLLLAMPMLDAEAATRRAPLALVHPAVFAAKCDQAAYWREEFLQLRGGS